MRMKDVLANEVAEYFPTAPSAEKHSKPVTRVTETVVAVP
jgi:hypothetical protein